MKTRQHKAKLTAAATVFGLLLGAHVNAQSWRTDGNAGISSGTDYLGTKDVNDMVIRTNAIERGRLFGIGGAWRFGTASNYATIDSTGKLSFFGKGFYQVDKNKYVFSTSNDPDIGLFYNSSLKQFEYRDKNALPVFFVNYETGAGQFNGSLKVGAYTLPAIDGLSNQVLKTNGAGVLAWSNDEDNNTIYNAGSGLSLSGNTFTNTSPDQTVTLAGTDGISVTGAYPNFSASGATLWGTSGNTGTAASTNFIGTTDNAGLSIRTNSTERMRVLADGSVGIGTSSPNSRLQVNSAAGEDALRVVVNGNTRFLVNDLGGTSIGTTTEAPAAGLIVSGNVGIGNFTPANKLDVNGTAAFTGVVGVRGAVNNSYSLNVNASSVYGGINITDAVDNYIMYASKSGSGYGVVFSKTSPTSTTSTLFSNNDGDGDALEANANTGFGLKVYSAGDDGIYASTGLAAAYAGYFAGDVYASAGYVASDANLKKEIKDVDKALDMLKQMRPRNYEYKQDGNYAKMNLPKGRHYGLLAQEIEKILPGAVKETVFDTKDAQAYSGQETDASKSEKITFKAVNYLEVIPVLVKAIQELEQQIQELKNEKGSTSTARSSVIPAGEKTNASLASLEQNAPNPFSSNTSIKYFIPANTQGQLLINDNAGNTVKKYNLTTKGNGAIQINAGELAAGTYYYTLIVDGKKADSKKMVLIK